MKILQKHKIGVTFLTHIPTYPLNTQCERQPKVLQDHQVGVIFFTPPNLPHEEVTFCIF
jgi:hypothetical protein